MRAGITLLMALALAAGMPACAQSETDWEATFATLITQGHGGGVGIQGEPAVLDRISAEAKAQGWTAERFTPRHVNIVFGDKQDRDRVAAFLRDVRASAKIVSSGIYGPMPMPAPDTAHLKGN
jgi:hypothetical protein